MESLISAEEWRLRKLLLFLPKYSFLISKQFTPEFISIERDQQLDFQFPNQLLGVAWFNPMTVLGRAVCAFLIPPNIQNSLFFFFNTQVTLVSAAPGKVICEMKVEEQHTNQLGTLHGGMTATLVDVISTLALLCTERGMPGVSIDMNITYVCKLHPK